MWLHYTYLGYLMLLWWIGFNFFNIGYFTLFPIKWEELDEEQKYQYGFNSDKLSDTQFEEWISIINKRR